LLLLIVMSKGSKVTRERKLTLLQILNHKKNSMEVKLLPITAYPLPRQGFAFVSHKHKLVYYEVPKAACSSIKLFIATLDGIVNNIPRHVHSLPISKLSLPGARSILYKDYFHFTFVRNPYDRLVSCYANKVVRPELYERRAGPFSRMFGELGYREMSFGDFVQFVTRVPNKHCDNHFVPQHRLLNLDVLDFIGRFESFNQDFLYVRKQIGVSDDTPQLQKMNASRHDPYQGYYDDKLRRMVARKYARDLEIFNYDF